MREIHRTLTIRLPLLAISITCGCALNFGQVNASGTVNATADTKIDTTVNASASVKQNDVQPTASPAPSATPTEAPKGRLTVLQNFQSLESYRAPSGEFGHGMNFGPAEFFPIFVTARERNITITEITFTLISEGIIADDALRDIRLSFSTIGTVQSLLSLKNGVAQFSNTNGLAVIPKDATVGITLWASGIYPQNEQMYANYSMRKKLGFSLKKMLDIRTDVPVEITGTFPIDGPLFRFCCYLGKLTPND